MARNVTNVHERRYPVPAARVEELVDRLASKDDPVWPRHWPRMRLDRGLEVGSSGGHGPIRYRVEAHDGEARVRFRFTGPSGFDGFHEFGLSSDDPEACVLWHRLEMRATGSAQLTWPLVFRPLHDALIEDAFSQVAQQLGVDPQPRPWPKRVRFLRRLLRRFA